MATSRFTSPTTTPIDYGDITSLRDLYISTAEINKPFSFEVRDENNVRITNHAGITYSGRYIELGNTEGDSGIPSTIKAGVSSGNITCTLNSVTNEVDFTLTGSSFTSSVTPVDGNPVYYAVTFFASNSVTGSTVAVARGRIVLIYGIPS